MKGKEREKGKWGKYVAGVEKFPATLWNLDYFYEFALWIVSCGKGKPMPSRLKVA